MTHSLIVHPSFCNHLMMDVSERTLLAELNTVALPLAGTDVEPDRLMFR